MMISDFSKHGQTVSELTRALLVYVPPQHEQFYRPYQINANRDDLNQLATDTLGGSHIDKNSVMDVTSRILAPASTPQRHVIIPGGFNAGRLAFFLEFTTDATGYTKREVVSGFTDRFDFSHNGYINPETVFVINNRQVIATTPKMGYVVQGDYSVLNRVATTGPGDVNLALRPTDVAHYMHGSHMFGGGTTFDDRYDLGCKSLQARRDDVMPTHYLSELLEAYAVGTREQMLSNDSDENLHLKVVSATEPSPLAKSQFVRDLGISKINGLSTVDRFTFSQLNSVWPRDFATFWTKTLPRPGVTMIGPRDVTEHWNNAMLETSLAYSISQTMTAIMTRLMISRCSITLRNDTLNSIPARAVLDMVCFFDGMATQALGNFLLSQVDQDVIRATLQHQVATYNITIQANLLSGCKIDIGINGEHQIPYFAPTFCDSQWSPLAGGTQNELAQLAAAVDTAVEYMGLHNRQRNPFTGEVTDAPQMSPAHHGEFAPPPPVTPSQFQGSDLNIAPGVPVPPGVF